MTRAARFARSATLKLPLGPKQEAVPTAAAVGAAVLFVACGVAVALAPLSAWLRAPLAMAFVAAASCSRRLVGRKQPPPHRWLLVDDFGVRRAGRDTESATLVDWREPFGATIFASVDRTTFRIALTTRQSARYVSARVADATDAAAAPTLFERATTAIDADLRCPDEAVLTTADAERLLRVIAGRIPSALDRVFLTNAGGEAVVLDGGELRVGVRKVDLSAPLEWRATIFQERGIHSATVCQATWVRQGESEFVLVAPLAGDGTWLGDEHALARDTDERSSVARAAVRDLRLMQATVGEPPPRELRCAIDRLFMLPLRRALDGAPQKRSGVRRSLRDARVGGRHRA